jgi:signal transduction histidine kinase
MLLLDVTAEMKAKIEMKKLLKQQEEFFANISHELNTPLNVISSTIQLLDLFIKEDDFPLNKASMEKYVYSLNHNCYRLLKLIGNIVDLSKIASGYYKLNKSTGDMVKLTRDIVFLASEYMKNKDLQLIFTTNIEKKLMNFDIEKIQRVLLNLLSNAIKFTHPGNKVYVNLIANNNEVEVSVSDTGIGIDEEHVKTIFNRFNQVDKSLNRNTEGIGNGLSIVKSIVELHGGRVLVNSRLGEGSKFTFTLPYEKALEENLMNYDNLSISDERLVNIELSDIY